MVKNLQQKLKKEMQLRKELNKKLKESKQETSSLKTYINKLEKELSHFKNEPTTCKSKEKNINDLQKYKTEFSHQDEMFQDQTTKNEETIQDLLVNKIFF